MNSKESVEIQGIYEKKIIGKQGILQNQEYRGNAAQKGRTQFEWWPWRWKWRWKQEWILGVCKQEPEWAIPSPKLKPTFIR